MIVTTTQTIEGKRIVDYKEVVFGEVIIEVFDIINAEYDNQKSFLVARLERCEKLIKIRNIAMAKMQERAKQLGANAVVAVDIDYQALGGDNQVMIVVASGTAVYCQ
jgi:uncharacterized protein YbjQ (UPF0145 family)